MNDPQNILELARLVAAETDPTDSVGKIARLLARKVIDQHEELEKIALSKLPTHEHYVWRDYPDFTQCGCGKVTKKKTMKEPQ